MGSLSQEQINRVIEDLDQEGITFEPLRSELIDHMISDIESKVSEGMSFEEAWQVVKAQIPENHFKQLQKETMEVLSGKFKWVSLFAWIAAGLLALGGVFKMMHWPGAGTMLLGFLVMSAVTLLAGSGVSVRVYKESKGRAAIWAISLLASVYTLGLCFKVLHLPGANQLIFFSSLGVTVLFAGLSIYFFLSGGTLRNHLLIRLIEDNQKRMRQIALFLIGFGVMMNYGPLFQEVPNYTGTIFFLFSIILVGMYTYAFSWKYFIDQPKDNSSRLWLLLSSVTAFVMFMMPMLVIYFFGGGEEGLGYVIRQFAAFGALILFDVIVCVHYAKYSDSEYKKWLAPLSTFLVFYPFMRLGIKLEWFEGMLGGLMTNPVFVLSFMVFLVILLIRFRKEPLFSSLIILTMTSHMLPNIG
ncbi:hypothetical protein [Reichenbachiella ulvae]|uniref:DUF2157 domain-containing protein n=1 Tax=Reichenbachiella ulvae TaxID=2980104 RepID=A0ABT3CUN6_9BACT|nr:hypothetical protein [Reichenbachiella ulvae]MCV9387329.1 hypothetical protein [Reichenbachiella ulvae]